MATTVTRPVHGPTTLRNNVNEHSPKSRQIPKYIEVDVKLNKWHIAMEKLYRKPTEKNSLKKIMTRQWD